MKKSPDSLSFFSLRYPFRSQSNSATISVFKIMEKPHAVVDLNDDGEEIIQLGNMGLLLNQLRKILKSFRTHSH
jgi:hypothetical protein